MTTIIRIAAEGPYQDGYDAGIDDLADDYTATPPPEVDRIGVASDWWRGYRDAQESQGIDR